MEETNNESIEKKLAYLNETKGLIKSAIINKGQELTDERYVVNPFLENNIMYKTGDICKFRKDGEIYCMGRIDNQVKIRGLRIELDEIE